MENGGVEVRIEDDGVGGAHPAKGSGLAGLHQRVLAADGRLEVSSPTGGPTVVSAFIPVGGSSTPRNRSQDSRLRGDPGEA
jgi:signal transduction histidine kinase